MENRNKHSGRMVVKLLKDLVTKNWGVKIAALLFAVVVWGVVLTTQNPPRIKEVRNVPVSLTNEYELHTRQLVVSGSQLEEMDGVTVRVNTPIASYNELSKEYVTASINLSTITHAGEFDMLVEGNVLRPSGSLVESTSPGKIRLEIDNLMTKRIPVETDLDGVLPEGYGHDEPQLSQTNIEIRGPERDVSRVSKAICRVNMDDRTQSYNDAVSVILVDAKGDEVDSSYFVDGLPAVVVRMIVYSKKTVPIDISASLLGADNLAANYEIVSMTATPAAVEIRGDADILEQISGITVQGIDLAGRKESLHENRTLNVPEGVTLLTSLEQVEVFIDIREKQSNRVFEAVEIETVGLGSKMEAELSQDVMDIGVSGRISLVDVLERTQVRAYVDLKGLKKGTYELPISISLVNDATTLELTTILSITKVTVTIK